MFNTHSKYSLRYGLKSPECIVDFYKEAGYTCAFITDINTSTAALSLSRYAQEKEFNAAVGIDVRNGMEQCYVILATNNRGFHELNTFVSEHLQKELEFPALAPYLSNCITIYPWQKAPKKLGPNEWIGVSKKTLQDYNWKKLKHTDKTVILHSMSFANKRDFNAHRLLRAIENNCLLSALPVSEQANADDLFISKAELYQSFAEYPEIIANTEEIAQSCSIHFKFGDEVESQNLKSYTGSCQEDYELVKKLCAKGMNERYNEITPAITTRVEKEIEIIREKEYLSYFLISWDIINYARNKGYFYVGRGSGANSIVAYLLKITDVDPLELDLYFERFINLYRKTPPDFDIDFSWKDRDDVTQYIFERFPNAALLCTYNTFQYKATVRELGKVFGLPKADIDQLSNGKNLRQVDEMGRLVLKYSKFIEGLPSHLSIHAGGIIISERPTSWYSACFMPPKGFPTTQFSMLEAEDVGLYKFDILSQRGLGKIKDCIDIIHQNQPHNPPHDIRDVAHFKEDPKIKEMLMKAQALGCFYVESPAMRMLMIKLEVKSYLELVAASSIIRPGVAQSGMMREYILRHKNPERRKEAHPVMLQIMPETYGIMVYQEDVIKVAHHFGGLTLGEADVLRRGMSGKYRSREEFLQVKDKFFDNCKNKGYVEKDVAEIWRQIESFAGYAFAKGHSASYAVESFQSLYLKAYYPLEYMLATINNFGGYYRTETYVHEARMLGAKIEAPSINKGSWQSSIQGDTLYLGFNLVHGCEHKVLHKIMLERQRRSFENFDDLINRVHIPLEQLNLIIRIGALRDFKEGKKELLWRSHFYHNTNKQNHREPVLFYPPQKQFTLPELQEAPYEASFEQMELIGFPLINPFNLSKENIPPHVTAEKLSKHLGQTVISFGYLITLKRSKTVNKDYMYFGTFMDINGEMLDTVHFPFVGKKYPFQGKGIYKFKGVVSEEFGYHTIEVNRMRKVAFQDDPRYTEVEHQEEQGKVVTNNFTTAIDFKKKKKQANEPLQ
ncbi:DNA polymerase III subunit alpha [Lishizhenia sp.]|uniref:DNA polymerase III subunit alpha n=1 Tax=Lishizhenia sp. TaxID=2497594 RepID=UPI00299D9189|nr:DNA polymerase III subunit alpha [Lishizhenia sp.]MDX1446230.1 DNA polymerase III subunit alpha [Lishizhenia sp.]